MFKPLLVAILSVAWGSAPMVQTVPVAAGGGQLFTEDCADVTEWTDVQQGTAVLDANPSGHCDSNINRSNSWVAAIQGDLDGTDEFCSMEVADTAGTNRSHGCIFRATATPGDFYLVNFSNSAGGIFFSARNTSYTEVEGANLGDCTGSWTDVDDGDYIGIHLQGTSTSTQVDFWDFGGTPPSDLQDPGTWDAHSAPDYTCSAAQLQTAGFAGADYRDSAGGCGPALDSTANSPDPEIDSFACGDTP